MPFAARQRAPAPRSPVLPPRLARPPHVTRAVAPRVQFLLTDRAQDLIRLGLAQAAFSPAATPGGAAPRPTTALRCPTTSSAPRGRWVVLTAAPPAAAHRELEVPLRGETVRLEQQGFPDRKSTRLNS